MQNESLNLVWVMMTESNDFDNVIIHRLIRLYFIHLALKKILSLGKKNFGWPLVKNSVWSDRVKISIHDNTSLSFMMIWHRKKYSLAKLPGLVHIEIKNR